jgi:hypothetical protein
MAFPRSTRQAIVKAWDAALTSLPLGTLECRRRLGVACRQAMSPLRHGERGPALQAMARAIQRNRPDAKLDSIRTSLRRSMQFAACCEGDRTLLPRLKRAKLTWRMTDHILTTLNHIQKLREEGTQPQKSVEVISRKLDDLLDQVAQGKMTGAALEAKLRLWRARHPRHFRDWASRHASPICPGWRPPRAGPRGAGLEAAVGAIGW